MDIRTADPDDLDQMKELADLLEACRRVDAPFEPVQTAEMLAGELRYGWDLEPEHNFVAYEGDVAVARGAVHVSEWDNLDLAWLTVDVHPDRRGAGIGWEVMTHVEARAQELGRSQLGVDAWEGSPGVQFVIDRHYDKKSQAILRRQDLTRIALDDIRRLHDQAVAKAADYEPLRIHGPVPEEMLAEYCEVAASINDAPLDDLEREDDEYNPKRMRDHEAAMAGRHMEVYRVVARHRESGRLGGHTAIAVERHDPTFAHQEDTAVAPAHRGHRLGLALKCDMLLWLAEVEPQLTTIDTWNTESNDFMISINELMGYQPVARALQFQKRV